MNFLIILLAKYLFAIIILISLYFGLRSARPGQRREYILGLVVSGVIAIVAMKLSGHFISDPRPFVVGHFAPLIAHAADNGFPSDHTAISALFAFAVWPYSRRVSAILVGLAVIVGAARVAAGVHHPLDIAGALLITLLATLLGQYLVQKFLLPRTSHLQKI